MRVNVATQQATFTCTQCWMQVRLSLPVLVPMPSGYLHVPADPLVRAMALHMRVGCTER